MVELWVGPASSPDTYRLVESKSSGGEGQLWRGSINVDGADIQVAIKVIHPHLLGDDQTVARGRDIELGPHIGETPVDLVETTVHVVPQINDILAERIEAGRGRLAETRQFAADLPDLAVSASGQDACRGGILFIGPHPPGEVAHLLFEGVDARFEVAGFHDRRLPAIPEVGRPVIHSAVTAYAPAFSGRW